MSVVARIVSVVGLLLLLASVSQAVDHETPQDRSAKDIVPQTRSRGHTIATGMSSRLTDIRIGGRWSPTSVSSKWPAPVEQQGAQERDERHRLGIDAGGLDALGGDSSRGSGGHRRVA